MEKEQVSAKEKKLVAHAKIKVNNDLIKREMIDGEEHIIVPCSTMPPDIIMNGVLYPAGEVKAAAPTLEGTPSPLGHPKVDGEMVSASNPRGANKYGVGAWNRSVNYTDKIHYEKVINVRLCKASPYGQQLLDALEKGDPIHTSTGIYCWAISASGSSNGEHYSEIATDILFDHDAILLEEPGAATPEKGTGIYVNHDKQEESMNEDKGTIAALANALSQLLKGNSEKQEQEKKEPSVGGEQKPQEAQGAEQGGEKQQEAQQAGQAPQDTADKTKDLDAIVGEKVEKALANALERLATNSGAQGATPAPMGFGLPSGMAISTNSNNDLSARLARLPE